MGHQADKEALEQRMIAGWALRAEPVLFPGQKSSTATLPRVVFRMVPQLSGTIGLGGNTDKERSGLVMIQIFTGVKGEDVVKALEILDAVIAVFNNWSGPSGKLITLDPNIFDRGKQGEAYQVNVNIPYRSQE